MTDGARAQDLAFLRSRGTDANAADAECRRPAHSEKGNDHEIVRSCPN